MRGSARGHRVTPARVVRTCQVLESSELCAVLLTLVFRRRRWRSWRRHGGQGSSRGESGYWQGKTSEGGKPKSVTGTKQGR
jgi:hypothetical protein